MVISSILRGLLALETNAATRKVMLGPHVPAEWSSFSLHNVRVGETTVDFSYRRTLNEVTLQIDSRGTAELEFSPAISPRARVLGASISGHRIPFQIEENTTDMHPIVRVSLNPGKSILRLALKDDFDIGYTNSLPRLGNSSRDLRIISELWSPVLDQLTVEISGVAGARYELNLRDPGEIRSVDGAELNNGKLLVTFPPGNPLAYTRHSVVLHFVPAKRMKQ